MKIRGDIERVNLATGERFQRVSGDGESRLEKVAGPEGKQELGAGGTETMRWISVEERCPAPNTAVLFWTIAGTWEDGIFRADEGEPIRWECARTGPQDERMDFFEGQVTHWLIPAAPEAPVGEAEESISRWLEALKEYAQLREEIGRLEETSECSCDADNFHKCGLCEQTDGLDQRCRALMNLYSDTWAMKLYHNDAAIRENFPKPCGICTGIIQSKDDLDWHGYGNCREIPEAIMSAMDTPTKWGGTQQRDELFPCPFCGTNAISQGRLADNSTEQQWRIQCGNPFCTVKCITQTCASYDDAVKFWQDRAASSSRSTPQGYQAWRDSYREPYTAESLAEAAWIAARQAAAVSEEEERQQFEDDFRRRATITHGFNPLTRNKQGGYTDNLIHAMWRGWLARSRKSGE